MTTIRPRDGALIVTGELAIASSRVELEMAMNVERIAEGVRRLEGRTTVFRHAAGLAWNKLGMIRGDATVHAQLTLERATSYK